MFHSILFKRLQPNARIPEYQTPGSSGADVYAIQPAIIDPGQVVAIPLGFAVGIPEELGLEIQVRPRSGLALKNGISVLNTPGTIDSDFRDELKVILINHGKEAFIVQPGMRVAQIVLAPTFRMLFTETDSLGPTGRKGGFGSTGV